MTSPTLAQLSFPESAVGHDRLGDHVWRVHFDASAPMRTVIAKSLMPEVAEKVERVARRWLPAVGLADAGPPLLRVVPALDARKVWHLYEDLGDWALDEAGEDAERLRAMVVLVAQIHRRFVTHSLLGEVLGCGRDLSAWAHESTIRALVRTLEAVKPEGAEQADLRARLLARFTGFLEEAPTRAAALRAQGGADTLVHGDLWPKNGIVVRTASGPHARLVDWDRAGVGTAIYDLSTLLSRVPATVREEVVEWYRGETDLLRDSLDSPSNLNYLAETCERTRLAEWTIWRIRAVGSPDSDWAWRELTRVESWLDVPALFPEARRT